MPQDRSKKRAYYIVCALILISAQLFFGCQKEHENEVETSPTDSPAPAVQEVEIQVDFDEEPTPVREVATAIPTPEPTDTPEPTERPRPHAVAESDPDNVGYVTELEVNGEEDSDTSVRSASRLGRGMHMQASKAS